MEKMPERSQAAVPDAFDVFDASHREIVMQLQNLDDLCARLRRAAPSAEDAVLARDLIAFFSGPARDHNYEEERHAFPPLLQCGRPELVQAAQSLQEEHALIELDWLDLVPDLEAVASRSAALDLPSLAEHAEVFSTVMRDHIAIEESLLYPELRSRLEAAVRRSASREIAARRARKARQSAQEPDGHRAQD